MELHNHNENNCRICRSDEFSLSALKDGFKYVKCSYCGVIRQYPYPTVAVIDEFYKRYLQHKNFENPFYLSDESWESVRNEKDLTFNDLKIKDQELKGKKVLDIGCATGLFIKYVNLHNAIGYGIDIQPQLIQIAQKNGLACELKDLFEIEDTFDLINMSHVIEHVDQPVKYIKYIYSILNQSGYFLIETPCTGMISETFESDWRFYMPIEHLHLFSQSSLFRILTDNGFVINAWIRYGSGNDSGTINSRSKKVADTTAKRLGIGDTISILCQKK